MTTRSAIGAQARHLVGPALDAALVDADRRTAALVADLERCRSAQATGWDVPRLPTINPPAWERGHLAWFAEWWTLRDPRPSADDPQGAWQPTRPSLLEHADRWFDSGRVAHDTRWSLDLAPRDAIADYATHVLDALRTRLAAEPDDDAALYPYRLALFHHDMHNEAFTYLRQTIDYPAPAGSMPIEAQRSVDTDASDLAFDAGRFAMGLADGRGFTFDNERRRVDVPVRPFAIDRACVSNAAYARFVDDGGYERPMHWSVDGRRWLASSGARHPGRWRRAHGDGTGWEQRWFGAWRALPLDVAVCHVNAHEAEAYARWAGRRLPTEAEWEYAATAIDRDTPDTTPFAWGDAVWEWTATPFRPYRGFEPDRYRDYSQPWFDTHRAVRGGSFATHPRMIHPRYRNFYTPERDDLFIGFRTCAR